MINKELASILALRVYDDDVRTENLPEMPVGWTELRKNLPETHGFGYSLYRSPAGEIVIAYRGTEAVMGWDGIADAALFLGFATSQAKQAAQVYVDIVSRYGADANVTFTGHSLGGGLASMMAVWFARPAIVFDSAPSEAAAVRSDVIEWVKRGLGAQVPAALLAFDPASHLVERERQITSHYATGEFLKELTLRSATTGLYVHPEVPVDFGNQQVSMFDMHSQALLTAGLLVPAFADAASRVRSALPLVMSERYYSPETVGLATRNFLLDLIRSEQASPGNGKLTHFAADLRKLGTNLGGLNAAAQSAIIAQAIEWYYWQGPGYAGQEFFTPANGALQYATAQGDALPGALNKAGPYTRLWLNPSSNFRTTAVPAFAQWNIATAGTGSDTAARDPNKNQIFVGGAGADRFTGGAANDLMLGGAGHDTYIVGGGRDRVQDDLSGEGALATASGQALGGGRGRGDRGQWIGTNGEIYQFTPTQSGNIGTLTISNLGAGDEVSIEKFDYMQATEGPGYLGVKLDMKTKVALTEGAGTRFWRTADADIASLAGRSSTVVESCGKGFTVNLSNAAKAGDKLQFNLLGLGGKQVKVVTGASTVDAESAVIDLLEGQTSVSFALVQDGGLDGDASGSLSVNYQTGDQSTASNSWGLTLQDTGRTANTYLGDQRAKLIGTETQEGVPSTSSHYGTYAWLETSWMADGTLRDGVPEPDFADVLYASTGNDKVDGKGGNDAFAAGAGHDVVDGGAGDDLIGGGSGSDSINGGDGNDYISSNGNTVAEQRRKPTDTWTVPGGATVNAMGPTWAVYTLGGVTVWDGMSPTLTASAGGDAVDAGAGNDVVIASWGDDRVQGGAGDDVVDGLAGSDVLEGGLGSDVLQGDGSVLPGLLNTVAAADHGGDFLDGGDGADVILGGGNADELFGGGGDDQIAGDSSGPTSSSAYVDLSSHGNDYLDGEAGNDYLEGGGGEDTLYGGTGHDTLWGDTATSFVTLAAHNALVWADDYLDGGEGNDTLIGGGKDDSLYGGLGDDKLWGDERSTALAPEYQGEDYLDGEDGADFLEGGGKSDTLFGGTGNDTLWGDTTPTALAGSEHGDDYLDGGDGDDALIGNGGADELVGGAGNDTLLGDSNGGDLAAQFHGDDYLDGGEGRDLLLGDGGNDVLVGGLGDDRLQGGTGDDELAGGDGADVLFGETGNDVLAGDGGDDQLVGGLGDDVLEGGEGLNQLYGQEGNDTLIGGSARDQLQGGTGDDVLWGGGGDDIYYYRRGEGSDHVADSGGYDRLVFLDVKTSELGGFSLGSLKIVLPDGGAVHLDDFDPDHPFDGSIELFQFTNGTFTQQQLIEALGFDIQGTPQDDTLRGTALGDRITALDGADVVTASGGDDVVDLGAGNDLADAGDGNDSVLAGPGDDYVQGGAGADLIDGGAENDVLYGGAGDDAITGGAGDDILAGEEGTDRLQGGDGDDAYAFGLGDGDDTVIDSVGANWIQLGAGIGEARVRLTRSGSDLVLAIAGTSDRLTVKDWFQDPAAPWTLALGDGTAWDRAAVEERILRNQPPVLGADSASVKEDSLTRIAGNLLANDADPDGRALRVTTAGEVTGQYGTVSVDPDGFFTYVLDNGAAAVQSLAEGKAQADRFTYTATDDDPAGAASSSSTLTVTVFGTNDLPVVAPDTAAAAEDGAAVMGNVLSNDSDIDAGTLLRVAAAGGSIGTYGRLELAADGAYTYTVDNAAAQVQSLGRNQQGSDRFAFPVHDGFVSVASALAVTITGRNDAPQVAIALPDQTAATSGNTSYSWQVPAGSFVDVDASDSLSYAAALADGSPLPSWMTFDAGTRTFSGRVPRTTTGYLDIQVSATDAAAGGDTSGSLSTADVFRLTFGASSGGGGGGGGGSKGNEGLGNGEDDPPPGHDTSFNDGPGTAPGDPGARGGRWHPTDAPTAIELAATSGPELHAAPVAIEVRGRPGIRGAAPDGTGAAPTGGTAKPGNGNGRPLAAPDNLGSIDVTDPTPAPLRSDRASTAVTAAPEFPAGISMGPSVAMPQLAPWQSRTDTVQSPADTFRTRWAAMDERLLAHLGPRDAALQSDFADNDGGSGAGFATGSHWRRDPLSAGSADRPLAVFGGLKEGLRQLPL